MNMPMTNGTRNGATTMSPHRYEESDENAVQEGYEAFNEERGEQ